MDWTIFSENLRQSLRFQPDAPMLFNSGDFLLFFTVFLAVYLLLFQQKGLRLLFVTAFSLFFYYKSSGLFVGLLLSCAVFNYYMGLLMERWAERRQRLLFLWLTIGINLSPLLYFKYKNFILSNWYYMQGFEGQLEDLILPVGISFFTFQTISYIVDVYRGQIQACRKVLDFAFYLSFFPQLVAGPIVRASEFLPQIRKKLVFTREQMGIGLFLILKGLVKKAVVADYLAQYANLIYGNPEGYSGFEHLMAMYSYTLQIYYDFSGYSDMAIGLALVLGFQLPENFRSPYQALNITDFWRRWHITLSSWLRDYIYIPLGGNRRGKLNQYLFLMITMLVGGLWHGASWAFVFWGGMHGLGLIVHKIWRARTKHLKANVLTRFLSWLLTFHFVAFLWVFFRTRSFEAAYLSIAKMFSSFDWAYFGPFAEVRQLLLLFMVLGFGVHFLKELDKQRMQDYFASLPLLAKTFLFILVVQLILQLRTADVQPFLYYDF